MKNFLAGVVITESTGILLPPKEEAIESRKKLEVSEEWKKIWTTFKSYFEAEMEAIEDLSLDKESKVMDDIISTKKNSEEKNLK